MDASEEAISIFCGKPAYFSKSRVCESLKPLSGSLHQNLTLGHTKFVRVIGSHPSASAHLTNQDEMISSGMSEGTNGHTGSTGLAPANHW
jgi:hypothetical protein